MGQECHRDTRMQRRRTGITSADPTGLCAKSGITLKRAAFRDHYSDRRTQTRIVHFLDPPLGVWPSCCVPCVFGDPEGPASGLCVVDHLEMCRPETATDLPSDGGGDVNFFVFMLATYLNTQRKCLPTHSITQPQSPQAALINLSKPQN